MRACFLICATVLTTSDIECADVFILQFCRRVEELYGKTAFTPNLHLHMHLKECLLDYGPPHAFWCFSFERFNGILGSYHTNKRDIESQFMRKFLLQQAVQSLNIIQDSPLFNIIPSNNELAEVNLSILNFCFSSTMTLNVLEFHRKKIDTISNFANNGSIVPLPPLRMCILNADEVEQLTMLYSQLYPGKSIHHLPHSYQRCGRVTLYGHLIGSTLPGGNNHASSVIMAFWPTNGTTLLPTDHQKMSVGIVQYFVRHCVHFKCDHNSKIDVLEHVFAYIWKKVHPNHHFYGCSATVSENIYELPSMCSFLPVQRIACLAAHAVLTVKLGPMEENVFVSCPIPIRYYL